MSATPFPSSPLYQSGEQLHPDCTSATVALGITGRGERKESLKQHPWVDWAPGCGTQQICSNKKKKKIIFYSLSYRISGNFFQHPLWAQSCWCISKGLIFLYASAYPSVLCPPHECLDDKVNKNNAYLSCPSFVYVHDIFIFRGKGTLHTFKWVDGEGTL